MRDHDDPPYVIIERHSAGLGAFVWGAILGAGAALLLAPRSGAETQEEIRQGVRRVRTAAEDRVDAVKNTVTRTRDRIDDQIGSAREQLGAVRGQIDDRTERAREALEAGRRAARDARAELERRVADVKDSYQSVAEKVARQDRPRSGSEAVVTDVAPERVEGGSDLG